MSELPGPSVRALITGASSGIGEAFARQLKGRGERLILVARRRDRLESLARELGEDDASVLVADLAQLGAARGILAEVARRGLEVGLLVNNAGLGHAAPFCDQADERVAAMLDVNVRALVEMTHAFVPGMTNRKRGRLINVVSNAAFQPIPFLAVYAATKAFVLSFTEALATELEGTGVRVQALCPGPTSTEFFGVAESRGRGRWINRMPTMSADAVVARSLLGLDRDELRVVAGFSNRALAAVQRFAPQAWARHVAASLYRPRES